jgi:hypothetical protein
MNASDFANYLKTRYENQIEWYSIRSSRNKEFYAAFQWGVILFSASVPVLIALPMKLEWLTNSLPIVLAVD